MRKATILLLVIIASTMVFADTLDNAVINNTGTGAVLTINTLIEFNNLVDNSSGIFFDQLSFTSNGVSYNCPYVEVKSAVIKSSSQFPLSGWNCINQNVKGGRSFLPDVPDELDLIPDDIWDVNETYLWISFIGFLVILFIIIRIATMRKRK